MRLKTAWPVLLLLHLLHLLPAAAAQDTTATRGLCWRARPLPRCQANVITNFGTYLMFPVDQGGSPLRATGDVGLLVNAGPRDALGATAFLSLDNDEFKVGAMARYRRWLGHDRSLELGLGLPFATGGGYGSGVYGLVEYHPAHWVAVSLRPEVRHYDEFTGCPPTGPCTYRQVSKFKLSAGASVGHAPGAALIGAGLATIGALIIIILGSGYD